MDKLKPCPFCGVEAFLWRYRYKTARVVYVECGACGAAGSGDGEEKAAAEAWNRRDNDAADWCD